MIIPNVLPRRALRLTALAAATLTIASLAPSVHAAVNLLTNPSFETVTGTFGSDGGQDLPVGSTAITGWTVNTNRVAPLLNGNPYGDVAEDGTTSLDLQSYSDGSPYGGVSQSVPTTIGDLYLLTFWVGVQNSVNGAQGPATVRASANNVSEVYNMTLTAPGQQWAEFALTFTAGDASNNINLQGISTAGGLYIGLDNISLTDLGSSTPEPASLPLLTLALPLLLNRRRA